MNIINCPSCGAPNVTEIGNHIFECNYCHTKFSQTEGQYPWVTVLSEEDIEEFKAALSGIARAGRDLAGAFKVVPIVDKPIIKEPAKPKSLPLGEFFGAWLFTIVLGLIADVLLNGQGNCIGVAVILGFIVGITAMNDARREK